MLYTGKGDRGTTKLFNTPSGERISKTAPIFDALGTVDELVASLGIAKVNVGEKGIYVKGKSAARIIHEVQETLFILQAELAGASMSIQEEKASALGEIINDIESQMPPIDTFFIAGGSEGAAQFDVCRTIARRMEREVLRAVEAGTKLSEFSLAYINRLSSLLYAFARLFNHFSGITETPPSYR